MKSQTARKLATAADFQVGVLCGPLWGTNQCAASSPKRLQAIDYILREMSQEPSAARLGKVSDCRRMFFHASAAETKIGKNRTELLKSIVCTAPHQLLETHLMITSVAGRREDLAGAYQHDLSDNASSSPWLATAAMWRDEQEKTGVSKTAESSVSCVRQLLGKRTPMSSL